MGCGVSAASSDIKFQNGKPTFKGDTITKCFQRGNGLLFRIVNKKLQQWAYYNDTTQYEMHVKATFGINCDVTPLGNAILEKLDDGDSVVSVVIQPGKTEMFIQGHVNGFKAKMDAIPLSGLDQDREEARAETEEEAVLTQDKQRKMSTSSLKKAEAPNTPEMSQRIETQVPKTPEMSQQIETQAPKTPEMSQRMETQAPNTPEMSQRIETQAPKTPEMSQRMETQAPNTPEMSQRIETQAPKTPEAPPVNEPEEAAPQGGEK